MDDATYEKGSMHEELLRSAVYNLHESGYSPEDIQEMVDAALSDMEDEDDET